MVASEMELEGESVKGGGKERRGHPEGEGNGMGEAGVYVVISLLLNVSFLESIIIFVEEIQNYSKTFIKHKMAHLIVCNSVAFSTSTVCVIITSVSFQNISSPQRKPCPH